MRIWVKLLPFFIVESLARIMNWYLVDIGGKKMSAFQISKNTWICVSYEDQLTREQKQRIKMKRKKEKKEDKIHRLRRKWGLK